MAEHNKIGSKGEQLAATYLQNKGYQILEQNWRCKHWEIDLIAEFNNQIIVIEVKTRRSDKWESPEKSVTNSKIKFLCNAIEAYLDIKNIDKEIRFDIISIYSKPNENNIIHIEEAFHPLLNN
ncbi:MAG: YraN family protein [Marinilabiliaceae bacterium]|nr:YraN family protein [Marinilabiliaceae bacterium]